MLSGKEGDKYWERVNELINNCSSILDIKGSPERISKLECIWGVKMEAKDYKFYENQCLKPQEGNCTSFVERKWKLTQLRKQKDASQVENARQNAEAYRKAFFLQLQVLRKKIIWLVPKKTLINTVTRNLIHLQGKSMHSTAL